MTVIAVVSATGAPGVTTVAAGLTWLWPQVTGLPVVLVDADPSGGGPATGWLRGEVPAGFGLLGLAVSHGNGRPLTRSDVYAAAVALDDTGHRVLVPGVPGPGHDHTLTTVLPRLLATLTTITTSPGHADHAAGDVPLRGGRRSDAGFGSDEDARDVVDDARAEQPLDYPSPPALGGGVDVIVDAGRWQPPTPPAGTYPSGASSLPALVRGSGVSHQSMDESGTTLEEASRLGSTAPSGWVGQVDDSPARCAEPSSQVVNGTPGWLPFADVVVVVMGSDLAGVTATSSLRAVLTERHRVAPVLVVVGPGRPYGAGEIATALDSKVVAVGWDPRAAAVLSHGAPRRAGWGRSLLLRDLTRLAARLTGTSDGSGGTSRRLRRSTTNPAPETVNSAMETAEDAAAVAAGSGRVT